MKRGVGVERESRKDRMEERRKEENMQREREKVKAVMNVRKRKEGGKGKTEL
jgi:hypothetical protein